MSLFDEYQIRRSSDPDMMSFARLDIPIPDQVVYHEYAVVYQRADHSRVGDGYPTLTWTWDVLSRERLATLLSVLDGEDYADVRIRTDARDGEESNAFSSFKTFDAVMWKPILSGKEGTPIARSSRAFQTVTVTFRKLVEV